MPFNRYLVPSDFGPGTVEPCAYAETYREIQAVWGLEVSALPEGCE